MTNQVAVSVFLIGLLIKAPVESVVAKSKEDVMVSISGDDRERVLLSKRSLINKLRLLPVESFCIFNSKPT